MSINSNKTVMFVINLRVVILVISSKWWTITFLSTTNITKFIKSYLNGTTIWFCVNKFVCFYCFHFRQEVCRRSLVQNVASGKMLLLYKPRTWRENLGCFGFDWFDVYSLRWWEKDDRVFSRRQ
jgi:hypothetical protein